MQAVYIVHAGLFFCYVANMLSVTYFSCGKTFLKKRKGGKDGAPTQVAVGH